MPIPQTDVESSTHFEVHVKNQGSNTWFDYTLDITKNNNFEDIDKQVTWNRNIFAILVFKGLKDETRSWLKNNKDSPHYNKINDIHNKASEILVHVKQELQININRINELKKKAPSVNVRTHYNMFSIKSGDWFEVWIGNRGSDAASEVEQLDKKIKQNFRIFQCMVKEQVYQEFRKCLQSIEEASFRNGHLRAVKAAFDDRVTMRILDLEKWIYRTGRKNNSNGTTNPNYIPGMEDMIGNWNLAIDGRFTQAFVTRKIHAGTVLKVLGVENRPRSYGKNPKTGQNYDVDLSVQYIGQEFPVQIGVREGELAQQVSNSGGPVGENIHPNAAVTKYGGTDIDYGKLPDFNSLRKKLKQTPPGGIVLWASLSPLLPMSDPVPLEEWYGPMLNKKCVVLWKIDKTNKASIHHNKTGFPLAHAEKLCEALGIAVYTIETDSRYSLFERFLESIL